MVEGCSCKVYLSNLRLLRRQETAVSASFAPAKLCCSVWGVAELTHRTLQYHLEMPALLDSRKTISAGLEWRWLNGTFSTANRDWERHYDE